MNLNQEDASAFTSLDSEYLDLEIKLDSVDILEVKEAILQIISGDPKLEYKGTISLRKLMSDKYFPVKCVINSNIIPKLLFLSQGKDEDFLSEVCWILINIAAGNLFETEFIIELNCIKFFIQIFESHANSFELLYNIVWCVGNISSENDKLRDIIVNSRLFTHVLDFIHECVSKNLKVYLMNSMWCLTNIIGDQVLLDVTGLDRILVVVLRVLNITDSNDFKVINEIIIALMRMAKKHVNLEYFTPNHFKILAAYFESATRLNQIMVLRFFKRFCKKTKAGPFFFQDEEVLNVLKQFISRTESTFLVFLNFLSYLFMENGSVIQKLAEMNFFDGFQVYLRKYLKNKPEKLSFFFCNALAYSDGDSYLTLKNLEYLERLLTIGLKVRKVKYLIAIVNTLNALISREGDLFKKKYSKKLLMLKNHCQSNNIQIESLSSDN